LAIVPGEFLESLEYYINRMMLWPGDGYQPMGTKGEW